MQVFEKCLLYLILKSFILVSLENWIWRFKQIILNLVLVLDTFFKILQESKAANMTN